MKLEKRSISVLVEKKEKYRLGKWASEWHGTVYSETLQLPSGNWRIVYNFPTRDAMVSFIFGLPANFGGTVKVD